MSRRRALVAALVALMVALGLFLLLRKRDRPRRDPVPQAHKAPPRARTVATGWMTKHAAPTAADGPIASLSVERSHACVNDTVGYDVEINPSYPDAPWLGVRIMAGGGVAMGASGVVAPSSAWLIPDRREASGPSRVQIYDTRNGKTVSEQPLPLTIDPCQSPAEGMMVSCVSDTPRPEAATCNAVAPEGFHPARFRWTFHEDLALEGGKISTATSPGPEMIWDYPSRIAVKAESTYVVEVVATDEAGHSRHGRTNIVISNHVFSARELEGVLEIEPVIPPHPTMVPGRFDLTGRLVNLNPEAVHLTGLQYRVSHCGEKEALPEELHPTREMLEEDVIPAGGSVTLKFSEPIPTKRCFILVDLVGEGVTSDRAVRGTFGIPMDPALMRQPSPQEMRRAMQAMAIISARRGEQVTEVTVEEMRELEHEGLLPPSETPEAKAGDPAVQSPSPESPPTPAPAP
jgi:hypothetical protein